MHEDATIAQTLLVHDGDLADVCALLGELGVPFSERRGPLEDADLDIEWGLVIASPQRMLRLEPRARASTRIAVMTHDSRTLRNSLRRAGIQLLVRRPVHPATMRALVLHALYRGPEKRRMQRVNVGASVTYRAGWRTRPAVLVDLSLGGCRLLTDRAIEAGAIFTLHVPDEVAGEKGFSAKVSVLRSRPDGNGRYATTARFAALRRKASDRLQAAVEAHAGGPAVFEGAPPLAADAAVETPQDAALEAPSDPGPAPVPSAPERRAAPRHQLERRVIALTEEATRVLMGRDITLGGMRVERHLDLVVGSDVLLAVHAAEQSTPLVVRAKVHRDDGERGMVLRFHALEPEAARYLNHVMDHLPLVDPEDEENGCLVTEILEVG